MLYDTLLADLPSLPRHPAFLGEFLLAKKVEGRSPRTLQWYCEALEVFERFCHSRNIDPDLRHVAPVHIRMWLAHLQDRGLSKSTVNNRFRALRAFFNWCVSEGIIACSPMRNMCAPSLGKIVIPVFSPEHLKSMPHLYPLPPLQEER